MNSAPLLALALVATAACGAEPLPPRPAPSPAAAPAPVAPGPPPAAAPTPGHTVVTVSGRSVEDAVLRPGGHVLLSTADAVLDWDPSTASPPRSVPLGVRHADRSPFLSAAGSRFVVARLQGDDAATTTTLDLWDATTLTKVRDLEGSYRTGEGVAAFSRDGSRFVFVGCVPVPRQGELSDCDAAVYALPEGTLVHRTRMPHLRTAIYVPSVEFSASGRYFAVSHEVFPTEVHESATGKLVYRSPPGEDYVSENALHVAFVDDTHLLAAASGKVTFADLENASATKRVDFKLPPRDFVSEYRIAPDGRTMALLLVRGERCRVVTWSLVDGKQTSQVLPPAAGPGCTLRWDGNTDLVARRSDGPATTQIRLDVATTTQKAEPAAAEPAFAAHGFTLHGDFDVSTDASGARIGMSHTQPDPLDGKPVDSRAWVGTPTGAKAFVDPQINGTTIRVDAERLLLRTDRGAATVVRKDGSTARLEPELVRKR